MTGPASITSPGSGRSSLTPGILAALAAVVALLAGATSLDQGSGPTRAFTVVLPAIALGLAAVAVCRPSPRATTLAIVGATIAGPVRGLFYDPVRDAGCPRCLPSPYALVPEQSLADGAAALGGSLVLAGLAYAAIRLRNLWAAAAAVAAGVSVTAYDSPNGLSVDAVWVSVALAAACVVVAVTRLALALNAVAHLTGDLRSGLSPDLVLRTRLADPTARVDFAAPSRDGSTRWVTANGEPVAEPAHPEEPPSHTTVVHSGGIPVARIHHTRAPVTLTPELALVMEQAGLEAWLAHQVAELERSRTRIVQRADSERRQLERDLHDGAQQYLLALAVELSLTPPDLEGALDATSRDALHDSRADADAALTELRAVARGVYPVLLDSGGLRPALQALGRRSGTTVTVNDPGATQLPPAGAAALCGLVEELATSGATRLAVDVEGADPVVVKIAGGTPDLDSLNVERIAASGGIVEVMPGRTVVSFP